MPRKKTVNRAGLPWPKCRVCKSTNTTGEGEPPDACFAICKKCGAKWKVCGAARNGKRCGADPNKGKLRCYRDGGDSPGAPLKTGRRSKYLPDNLLERYNEVLENEDIVSLEEDLRVLEALILDNLAGLQADTAKSAEWWKAAKECYQEALKGGKPGAIALKQLGAILENGLGEQEKIRKHLDLTERKRRLAETEGRRQAQAQFNFGPQELAAIKAFFVAILREKIRDPEILREINAAILSACSGGDRPRASVR